MTDKESIMVGVNLVLDGDGAFPEMEDATIHHFKGFTLSALKGGMTSGKPSVAVMLKLDDGSYVMAEASLRQLLAAVDVLKEKYKDDL
jgi:hypothetical protein